MSFWTDQHIARTLDRLDRARKPGPSKYGKDHGLRVGLVLRIDRSKVVPKTTQLWPGLPS